MACAQVVCAGVGGVAPLVELRVAARVRGTRSAPRCHAASTRSPVICVARDAPVVCTETVFSLPARRTQGSPASWSREASMRAVD